MAFDGISSVPLNTMACPLFLSDVSTIPLLLRVCVCVTCYYKRVHKQMSVPTFMMFYYDNPISL